MENKKYLDKEKDLNLLLDEINQKENVSHIKNNEFILNKESFYKYKFDTEKSLEEDERRLKQLQVINEKIKLEADKKDNELEKMTLKLRLDQNNICIFAKELENNSYKLSEEKTSSSNTRIKLEEKINTLQKDSKNLKLKEIKLNNLEQDILSRDKRNNTINVELENSLSEFKIIKHEVLEEKKKLNDELLISKNKQNELNLKKINLDKKTNL